MPSTIEKELEEKIIAVFESHYTLRGTNRPTLARIAQDNNIDRVDVHDYRVEHGLSQEYRYSIGKMNLEKLRGLKKDLYP